MAPTFVRFLKFYSGPTKDPLDLVKSVGDLILIILAIFDFNIFLDHFGAFWTNPFFFSFNNTIRTNTGNIPYIFFLLSPSFKNASAPP